MTGMPDSATGRLRDALAHVPVAAYVGDPEALAPLDQLMCELVEELKAKGMAAEHVLLAVKGIAFEAGLGLTSASLLERLVTRCIEEYFKSPGDEGATVL